MTMMLETDVLVDVLRGHAPAVEWLAGLPASPLVAGYTALELYAGCRDLRAASAVDKLLGDAEVRWASVEGASQLLRRFARLWLKSGIGPLDILIAQTAIEASATLATFNTRHFASVSGLSVEQPYER